MRHLKTGKLLLVYSILVLSQRAVAGSLTLPNLEYGARGSFSLNRTATSCLGEMEKNFSGILGYSFSSCTVLGSIPNRNPVGVQMGTLNVMRSLLNAEQLDIYTAGSPSCPNSNATYNYITLRARASDHNFDSDSAFSAGRVTYQSNLNRLVVEQRYSLSGATNSTSAIYNGLMSCSGNSVARMKVESGNEQVFNSLISLVFGETLSYVSSFGVGTNRAPLMSLLAPVQTLTSETFSNKADQAYSGLYTEWNKTGAGLKRVVYAAPQDATGLKFNVFQMTEGQIDDFSQKVLLGALDCSNLNSPTNGFCSGTFSKSGISQAGAARCLFRGNLNSQDLFFCEAQLPHSNPSLHLKQMVTFQLQTTTRVKLAVVPSNSCTVNGVVRAGCNLEPGDAEGEITVTIQNKSSKTTDIALGSTPTDFTLPSSLANTPASFFQDGGECGSQLAAFSSCTIKIKYAPQEEKVNSDYVRIAYDKKDGTPNSVVNATGPVKTSKGLEAIEVTPSSTTANVGEDVSMLATARFKSGGIQDITNLVTVEAGAASSSAVNVTQASSSGAARMLASQVGTHSLVIGFGAIQATAAVEVVAAPLTPNAFSAVLQPDNSSALLSWQNGGNPNQRYQLAYKRNGAPANCSSDTVIPASTLGQNLSHTLSSLIAGSTYYFKLCGINSVNTLSAPAVASVTTPVVGVALVATNGQVLNDGTSYSSITVPNGVTLNIGPSFSGLIGNLTVKSGGILTASNSFSNSNPSADLFNLGNKHGRLYLLLAGDLTVESGGLITMDGKGYPGGGNGPGHNGSRAHGLSHSGYGATGAGLNFAPTANCYHTWRAGGGGGYGTPGGSGMPMAAGGAGGTSFGASDFTTKLYLGSGGAGGACWDQGGKGGGAIYIEASNISVAGTISARGTKPSVNGGGGSGGTIVLNSLGSLSNTGAITTDGGTHGSSANIGGTGRVKLIASSFASMSGSLVGVVPSSDSELRIANVALNENITTLTRSAYGASTVARTGTILNMASLKVVMGSQAPQQKLDFNGAGHFDFNSFLDQAGYDIVIGDQQHFYLNASWGQPRNVTVESGGVLTANAYATSNPSSDSFNLSSMGRAYGNGRLIMDRIQGTFHVKAGGYVTMSGKGHLGGGNLPGNNGSMAHGQSPNGYGLGGAGRTVTGINCYHSYRYGSGASYGEVGGIIANGGAAGSIYGLSDFDTQLYLGSGGGGSGCWERGGTGGGAIYVGAQNIINEGYIDASGRKAYHANGGGGSGGTIVLNASSSVTNSGKVNAEGGRGVMSYSLSQSSFYAHDGWNGVVYSHPWYLYDSRRGVGRGTNADWQSWIQADMGSNQVVDVITISPHDWWPYDYLNDRLLQYYNGSTWVTYKTIAGTTLARDNHFVPNINARYWRIINPDNRRHQHILIGEFVLDSSAAPDSAFLANKGGKGRVKFNANSVSSTGTISGIVSGL